MQILRKTKSHVNQFINKKSSYVDRRYLVPVAKFQISYNQGYIPNRVNLKISNLTTSRDCRVQTNNRFRIKNSIINYKVENNAEVFTEIMNKVTYKKVTRCNIL